MDVGRVRRPQSHTFLQNRPSHWTDIAPLICRVVRAVRVRGRWAWIPGRAPSVFFPTSDPSFGKGPFRRANKTARVLQMFADMFGEDLNVIKLLEKAP